MKIRIGYVAIALNLGKVTSSGAVTYTHFSKLTTVEKKLDKLKLVTLSNLNNLLKILKYTNENQIHFYRITSALVPLATHPEVKWDYRNIFKKDFRVIGDFIKEKEMRVDTHPDQFNVINSERSEVVKSTMNNLMAHVHLFEDLDYPDGKMVIHVGSSSGGKLVALERFKENYNKMPREITNRLILENDDKTFTTLEVLKLCRELSIPMVLDVHHHICNNNGEKLEDILGGIFDTWKRQQLPPKIHFSSPREGGVDRKHADFIEPEDFINFLELAKRFDCDFDVMIEAKMKDLALFKIVDDIKVLRPKWKQLDRSSYEI